MRCRACEAPLDAKAVFPGGTVRCRCGVDNELPPPKPAPTHDPYREPATHPTPPVPQVHALELRSLCPRCTRMLREDVERSARMCERCHGSFVDHTVLAALVDGERARREVASAPHPPRFSSLVREVRYARCPGCGQPMTRMTFGKRSGVVVDVCHEHGTWFDGGELDAVLAFVRGGGMESDLAEHPLPPPADLLWFLASRW